MPKVKSASEIAGKYSRVTPQRQADFEAGVKDTAVDWAGPTANAEGSFESGIQNAINRKAFSKGVKAAGTEHWRSKVITVGVNRWGPGVRAATVDYEKGFAPYRDVIESTTLPPRYAKGDPRNIERVVAMAKALHDKKVT